MKRPLLVLLALVGLAGGALVLSQLAGGGGSGRRVVVYTAHPHKDVDALLPRFEQETGITLDVVKLASGEVAQRVRAEKDQPRCDVIWSIAGDQLEGCADLLDEVAPKETDVVDPASRVDGARWLPYSSLMLAIVVNTKLVAEAERPRTWADLAAPRWKGKVSMARADASGSAYMQLVTILDTQGARGWDVYRGILDNTVFAPSSSAVPQLVNDGEAEVGLTLEDNALRYVRAGGPVTIVYPADGTVVAPDGVALVKGAPHPAEARAFIDWALSKATQDVIVELTGRRPVRKDGVTAPGLPALSTLRTVPYRFAEAAARKQELLGRWSALVVELGK